MIDGGLDSIDKGLIDAFSKMIGILAHNARGGLGGIRVQAVQGWLTELDVIVADADKLAAKL